MKIFIVAKHKEVVPEYIKSAKRMGFEYSRDNPDIVLSLGGDGTYLVAENMFPSIPKYLIRDSNICNKCTVNLFEGALKPLKDKNRYRIDEWLKIEGSYQRAAFVAANDIIIRNKDQRQAIRFRIRVNNIPVRHEYIGDGVVFATAWGSTGYFKAITKRSFKKGIGIALNNTNTTKREIIAKENSKIELEITRGDAVMSFDNAKEEFTLRQGDRIIVKRHRKNAKVVTIKK